MFVKLHRSHSYNVSCGCDGVILPGPMSVGLDIAFHQAKNVYGVPEHADAFALKPTM